ncbi:hypothetical protein BX661DRAFT_224039 [Kickxella alabastrina]|uniref:uncharacterized protein n=1 Tax=Kickxella alabastrina TaxID=61397 RepID=UPI00221F4C71|nr:uncharacterized protein BX661DRAFT_224039 [Kickxella alabastrina]KAI7830157.1 hypothetical protein BX661DRAFT_224039 [Kickxella alabastrina]
MSQQSKPRSILPNGTIERPQDGYLLEQALLRKRERNKIAARRKRDRKKQRMDALEQREKELRHKHMSLELELLLYQTANKNRKINEQGRWLDYTAINAEIAELHDSVVTACNQAQVTSDTLILLKHEITQLLEFMEQNRPQ